MRLPHARATCALALALAWTSCGGRPAQHDAPTPAAAETNGELGKVPASLGRIVVAGDDVLFTCNGDAKTLAGIYAVPRAGGPQRVVARWQGGRPEVTSSGGHVFVADESLGWLGRVPQSGGRLIQLASDYMSVGGPSTDGSSVYFVGDGALLGTDVSGGAARLLVTSRTIVATAVDDAFVYSIDLDAGTVLKTPKVGGQTVVLATSQKRPLALALAAADVVFLNQGSGPGARQDGAIMAVPRDGGAVRAIVSPAAGVGAIAVDVTWVYWTSDLDAGVFKASLAGGDRVRLADVGGADAVAVDDAYVYYNDYSAGTLWRKPK